MRGTSSGGRRQGAGRGRKKKRGPETSLTDRNGNAVGWCKLSKSELVKYNANLKDSFQEKTESPQGCKASDARAARWRRRLGDPVEQADGNGAELEE